MQSGYFIHNLSSWGIWKIHSSFMYDICYNIWDLFTVALSLPLYLMSSHERLLPTHCHSINIYVDRCVFVDKRYINNRISNGSKQPQLHAQQHIYMNSHSDQTFKSLLKSFAFLKSILQINNSYNVTISACKVCLLR